jgi:aldehyde dehydrogenase (NAD+)
MRNLDKFYIDGEWITPNSRQSFPVLNPATEARLGTIYLGNQTDLDSAVAAARGAFATYSQTLPDERIALLERLLVLSDERREDLAQAMTAEMGAPITMSRDAQADAAVGHLTGILEALKTQSLREVLATGDVLVREPIGVCGLITPWNWPINQIALKVLPALATGCTCVLKPSEHTPLSAIIYTQMIHDAGFPSGVFNMLHGDGLTVGAGLSRHADVDMMSFTGSSRAGIEVTKDAADTVKRVTLELGGKSPNIVFADCNLGDRVSASVLECMYNTGQSCDAPTRLIVERACYEQVLGIAKTTAEGIVIGDPTQDGDQIGPLFDRIQFDRVQSMIETGIAEGATLLCGGMGRPEGLDRGWYVRPTIFADVTNDMAIAQQEIFGPVLVIIPFDDEEDAIRIANDTPYGLAAYLQTGDADRAERVAARLQAGAIHINGGGFNYGSPFGGYKQSGNGREGGLLGLEDYQEIKTLHFG